MSHWSVQEIAKAGKVSTRTVQRWISKGEVQSVRLGPRRWVITSEALIMAFPGLGESIVSTLEAKGTYESLRFSKRLRAWLHKTMASDYRLRVIDGSPLHEF